MKSEWDEYADGWDSDTDVILYSQKAFRSLVEKIDIAEKTILDFGCGTGLLTDHMAGIAKTVVALDSSSKMTDILQRKNLPNVTVINELLSEELIENRRELQGGFDLVVASSVCAFLPNYPQSLHMLASLLANNGVFIQWDWLQTPNNPEFGLAVETVEGAFNDAGLHKISINQPFSLESKQGSMPVLMAMGQKI